MVEYDIWWFSKPVVFIWLVEDGFGPRYFQCVSVGGEDVLEKVGLWVRQPKQWKLTLGVMFSE